MNATKWNKVGNFECSNIAQMLKKKRNKLVIWMVQCITNAYKRKETKLMMVQQITSSWEMKHRHCMDVTIYPNCTENKTNSLYGYYSTSPMLRKDGKLVIWMV